MVQQMEDMGCIGGIVLAETIRSLDRAALGFDDWTVSPAILQVIFRHTRVYLLGLTHCTWYCASRVLRQMGIDQTIPIVDDFSADSAITPGVTRAVLRAWVRDHHMVRPLPNPAGVQTSPEYRAWFIAVIWPVERPRRTVLLSALEVLWAANASFILASILASSCSMRFYAIDVGEVAGVVGEAGEVGDSTVGVAGTDVPAQRYQEICQRFGFARSYIGLLYSERHERDLEIGRLRRHQSCQSSAVSRLQAEVDRLRTRLEVEGIPLDSSEEDEDGSSSDDVPPSPPHPAAAGPSRRRR
ncbi:hypothetical protein JCGZ_07860 [Jatropha curcas]|uniref:Aminotransferase-like plant mobile domain-containing protein n=1 Tax=Jatropha curcas TaxID=180498 RepID=A0A067KKI2_JATCU|nr:hypothetical protein JCGZ_07860 [Jatropha curcas]